ECAQSWPPEVAHALGEVVREVDLTRYPDTSGRSLRAILAKRYGCPADDIVLGNGSDEIIALLLTALAGPGTTPPVLVVPTPTFVMYSHTARVLGYEIREAALNDDLELDPGRMRDALAGATVCFIARPNNPTGGLWDAELVRALVAEHPDVVFVVDEAYCAYAPDQSLWRDERVSNQVHMATLSKVGMAALRLGYCIADPTLCLALNKVRHPYNVSATSLALAGTILTRFADAQASMVAETLACRELLTEMLGELPDTKVFPSHANFVLVRLPGPDLPARLCAFLAQVGILVKDVSTTRGLAGCLRVGVGTRCELARLHERLQAWSHGER
ncbi:MAG: aminotransferase class I/II-fold pyridoxal phosphate-dependent enzyme, partial [Nannocystaceae bacterium]|nr:aminotransferase class I/II-fold pyridoxal phosphate-dependent enzyme [Nannocystaceae bacterium]